MLLEPNETGSVFSITLFFETLNSLQVPPLLETFCNIGSKRSMALANFDSLVVPSSNSNHRSINSSACDFGNKPNILFAAFNSSCVLS